MGFVRFLKSLRRNDTGTASIELLLMVPMFVLIIGMTMTSYGYFKASSRDAKAAYAMADAISRETRNINPDFMTTLRKMQSFITDTENGVGFRISVVDYSPYKKDYRIRWSRKRQNGEIAIPAADLERLRPNLPNLANFETILVMETFLNHQPFRSVVGLEPVQFRHVAISRPRNGPQICWSTDTDPTSVNRKC